MFDGDMLPSSYLCSVDFLLLVCSDGGGGSCGRIYTSPLAELMYEQMAGKREWYTITSVWGALNIKKYFAPSIKFPVLKGYGSRFEDRDGMWNQLADRKLHLENPRVYD